ncbi:sialate O-acetylesterase, partial [Caulobacter sp. HMWF025]|uniref:sialate O-acetylesterase n=1 Tax=Caulobacter sp. HMWF025 TaxID=2056860 RepID=UPI000D4100D5
MIFLQERNGVASLTYVGDSARVLKDGQVIIDWTSGGSLAAIPIGDGYELQVRSGSTTTSTRLAVGEIILALGQSNMVGWFQAPSTVPTTGAGAYVLQSGDWTAATGAGALTFARVLSEGAGNAPVAFINASAGGTALLQEFDTGLGYWLNTAANGLLATAVNLLKSVGGSAKFAIWIQGEAEGSTLKTGQTATQSAYAAGFETLLQRLFSAVQVENVVVGGLGHLDNGQAPFIPQGWAAIVAAQQQVVAAHANMAFAAAAFGLEQLDGGHYTGASRAWQAADVATAALSLM